MDNSNVNPVEERPSWNKEAEDNAGGGPIYIPSTVVEHIEPVTEPEMNKFQEEASSFFGRIVSTVVSMSEQAKELDKLRQEVSAATAKLQELIDDNARKAEELSSLKDSNAWLSRTASENGERATKAEATLNEAQQWIKTLEDDHATVVAKLTTTIEADKASATETAQRYHDTMNSLNTRTNELQQRVRDLEQECATLQRERDQHAADLRASMQAQERVVGERDTLRNKLDTLRSAFAA